MTSPQPDARSTAAVVATTLAGDDPQGGTVPPGDRDTLQGHTKLAMPATVANAHDETAPTRAEPVRGSRQPFKALILIGVMAVLAAAALFAFITSAGDQTDPTSPTPNSGGTAISTPAQTPPSTVPVGQPAVVVTARSTVPPPSPIAGQPNDQTPNTTPVITSSENVDGNGGNGNNGNGNNRNGGNGGNGNNRNGGGTAGTATVGRSTDHAAFGWVLPIDPGPMHH
jgi:hypothetical protein